MPEVKDRPPVNPDDTVCLVGNGPGAVKFNLGKVIDAFDCVVRFNNFKLLPEKTGIKTDLYSTFGRKSLPQDGVRPDRVLFIHGHAGNPSYQPKELFRLPRPFYGECRASLKETEADAGIIPSSGYLIATYFFSLGVKCIHLVGFDHFAKNTSGQHHWWMKQAYTQPKEHKGKLEAQIFNKWQIEGKIYYLS